MSVESDDKELAALEMQAGAVDGEVSAQAPEAQMAAIEQAQAFDLASENSQGVRMMLDMAIPMLGAMYPSLEAVYTEQTRQQVAMALGPVMAKHGVSLKEWGGKYGEEIAAVFVCGPIALATYKGIKNDIEARHAPRLAAPKPAPLVAAPAVEQEGPAPASAPASDGLAPGAYGYKEPGDLPEGFSS